MKEFHEEESLIGREFRGFVWNSLRHKEESKQVPKLGTPNSWQTIYPIGKTEETNGDSIQTQD